MTENSAAIVQKVWNYAHVMRDDGLSYGDYVEQITFLIFLKMAQERMEQGKDVRIQKEYQWKALAKLDGDALEIQYRHILEALGKYPGLLGVIFKKAQNKISDPAKLAHLINMIGKEDWSSMSTDVKGDIYEGLLEKNASDVKGGAGQYFTPRPLIRAMVEVMRPKTGMVIADPACGTGGFLLAAYDYIEKHQKLDHGAARHLKEKALRGADIVDSVVRLCAMNLYLHGIGGDESPVESKDALRGKVAEEVDMVLTNPPFGKKSSVTIVGENGEKQQDKMTYERDDFWATTSNKQLNFVQHVVSIGTILGTIAGCAPISFFDTHYYKNRDKYHPGMKAKFMLSGLVYMAGNPKHNEVVIDDPEKLKAMRQAGRPDVSDSLEPIKISLDGAAILFQREDLGSDDYDFMVKVDEIKRIHVRGIDLSRLKATLMRPDDYDFNVFLYIADSALDADCMLELGKCITGVLWLQGYLVE